MAKSTLRMLGTLLLLIGVGWITGALSSPFAGSPARESASTGITQVASATSVSEPESAPVDADVAPAEAEASEISADTEAIVADDTSDEDDSADPGLNVNPFDDDFSADDMDTDGDTSADFLEMDAETDAPMP